MSRNPNTLRLVTRPVSSSELDHPRATSSDMVPARMLSDKASLLRPLKDEHLLEVYREAKKMNLSAEFIELLEDAIALRQLNQAQQV